ncbi:hypothetical protein EV191_13022 [Tamaricihabitans halophyticus]|uniref:Uncharacterized protein n=1 Tax=Tamaricihabitans halophyticus TaxID=1262583 RepID=A0A4R2PVU4_9PSEU|nr:hypothetical protein [Tamaricihabitans halophyticus]TCP39374.1 hypothetical protein EV191_13022 [Tamaricihabitans halophyticus]
MADLDAERLLHEFQTSAATDVTISLLRSRDALVYLALMASHLGDGQIVDGETLTVRIDEDLPRLLRSHSEIGDAEADLPDADGLPTEVSG